jgi:PAS domain S-box-containing protein
MRLEEENRELRAIVAELERALESQYAEEALKKSGRLYRAIAESIDYGIWVCAPDGRNVYASPSFLNLVGITQEQCSNFGWGAALHPDEAEQTIAAWRECVRTGGTWDIEHRFMGADGEWHDILARGVPVRDERGEIECWAGINLDIGARRRAERERDRLTRDLAERLGDLQAVLDAAPVAIWIAQDPQCLRITGNDYADQMIMRVPRGGNVSHSARPGDANVSYRVLQQGIELCSAELPAQRAAATGEAVPEQEFRLVFSDGRRVDLQMGARPLFDAEGRVRGAVAAGADVTRLRLAEDTLLKQQHQLQALTSRLIAVQEAGSKQLARELHDGLSQKVAVVALELDAIDQWTANAPRDVQDSLERIARQVEEVSKDIRQMARLLHPAILDDLGLAPALESECLGFSKQYGMHVDFTARDMPATLPEDVSLCVYRVTQECLRNVAKHAGKTTVAVAVQATDTELHLSVRDSGCGFEQDGAGPDRGLGLVSMKERVKLVGGEFGVESQPGQGTRVEVRIPRRKDTA